MDVKNDFVGIKNFFSGSKNFKKISTEIVHESLSIDRDTEALVYAKKVDDSTNMFVAGNIGAMICLIADMIILISEKSGAPISAISLTISTLINDQRGTLR